MRIRRSWLSTGKLPVPVPRGNGCARQSTDEGKWPRAFETSHLERTLMSLAAEREAVSAMFLRQPISSGVIAPDGEAASSAATMTEPLSARSARRRSTICEAPYAPLNDRIHYESAANPWASHQMRQTQKQT